MADKHTEEQGTIEKLNDNLTSVGTKVAENKKVIFWVVFGVAVVAAFVLSYLFIYRNPRLQHASEEYNQVEITAQGNDSIAAAGYKKVADQYHGSEAGNLAALSAGEAYYNMGKYKEAAQYLEKAKIHEPVLAANILVLTGDCYVNLKNYDKALDLYEKALKKAGKNEQIAPRVLLKKANVYDEQKKYDAALRCYELIKADYPQYTLGNGMSIDAYIERETARLGK